MADVGAGPDPVREFLGSASVFASMVSALVNEALNQVSGEYAMSMEQLRIVELVSRTGALSLHDIARGLSVSDPAASRAVDRLVRRGFLARERGKGDRRTVRVSLTPEGVAVLTRYHARVTETIAARVAPAEPGRIEAMTSALDHFTHRLLAGTPDGNLPCRGCLACNLFRRDDCPLGHGPGEPHTACLAGADAPGG